MSDALLTRIADGIDALRADLKKGFVGTVGATAPKPAAGAAAPDAAKVAAKKAADAAAAKKIADAAAAAKAAAKTPASGPAAGTKGPGGKHTIEQVREAIRKVAANASLGKASAKEILADDGGGVERVADVKPENYDKVFEACQVLLASEGAPAAAAEPEDDLM